MHLDIHYALALVSFYLFVLCLYSIKFMAYHTIFPNYRLFKLIFDEFTVHIIPRDAPLLVSVGPQKCLAFSTDGAKFAIGGDVWFCIILISEFQGSKLFSSHFVFFGILIVCFLFCYTCYKKKFVSTQQYILTVCTFKILPLYILYFEPLLRFKPLHAMDAIYSKCFICCLVLLFNAVTCLISILFLAKSDTRWLVLLYHDTMDISEYSIGQA